MIQHVGSCQVAGYPQFHNFNSYNQHAVSQVAYDAQFDEFSHTRQFDVQSVANFEHSSIAHPSDSFSQVLVSNVVLPFCTSDRPMRASTLIQTLRLKIFQALSPFSRQTSSCHTSN
ncbi:MAG: hypothetical protein ACKPKO_60565, partial [Candidatus Fonsibacter sp.]